MRLARLAVGSLVSLLAACHALSDFPEGPELAFSMDSGADLREQIDLVEMDSGFDIAPDIDTDIDEDCGSLVEPPAGILPGRNQIGLQTTQVHSLALSAVPFEGGLGLGWAIVGDDDLHAKVLPGLEPGRELIDLDLTISRPSGVALRGGLTETVFLALDTDSADCSFVYFGSILFNGFQSIELLRRIGCSGEPLRGGAVVGGTSVFDNDQSDVFWVWFDPEAGTMTSMNSDLAEMTTSFQPGLAQPDEVYGTTGALIVFRSNDGDLYAWDAHQPDVSRVLQQPSTPPFQLDDSVQAANRSSFDIVHLRDTRYVIARVVSGALELVTVDYDEGAFKQVSLSTYQARNPRWISLTKADQRLALSFFEDDAELNDRLVFQIFKDDTSGLVESLPRLERRQDMGSMKWAESTAFRSGCDLSVARMHVTGTVTRYYDIQFPTWQNAYERKTRSP